MSATTAGRLRSDEVDRHLLGALPDVDPARVSFVERIPNGARKTRRRLFVDTLVDGAPRLVAKIPLDRADAMVQREWDVLTGHDFTAVDAPTALARLEGGFVMSWVPSEDLPTRLAAADATRVRELLFDTVDRVIALHGAGTASTPHTAAGIVGDYLGAAADDLPEHTRAALDRARLGVFHGDLGPWNVRVRDTGEIGVIDWEDFLEVGVQALDVLNLVLTGALAAHPQYASEGKDWLLDVMLDPAGEYGATAVAAIRRYTDGVGCDAVDIGALVPVFSLWMIERIRRQDRATDHLFYGPLLDRYLAGGPAWLEALQ